MSLWLLFCCFVANTERKKVSFLHQRSYSCGDLSPSETEKDEENDDSDEDQTIKVKQGEGQSTLTGRTTWYV